MTQADNVEETPGGSPGPGATRGDAGDRSLGYAAAVAELDAILRELEDDDVDVDVLTARVRRASELVRLCRDRIASTKLEVAQIVADLDPGPGADADAAGGGSEVW